MPRAAFLLALMLAAAPWQPRAQDRLEREREEWRRAVEERDATRVPGDVQTSEPAAPAPAATTPADPEYRRSAPARSGGLTCAAFPRCMSGGANACKGVAETLPGPLASARSTIVQRCVQANTPDACGAGCVPQCAQVARCY